MKLPTNRASQEKLKKIYLNTKLKKDNDGYYNREDLELLETEELIKLFIDETSCQEVMNSVRKDCFDFFE